MQLWVVRELSLVAESDPTRTLLDNSEDICLTTEVPEARTSSVYPRSPTALRATPKAGTTSSSAARDITHPVDLPKA